MMFLLLRMGYIYLSCTKGLLLGEHSQQHKLLLDLQDAHHKQRAKPFIGDNTYNSLNMETLNWYLSYQGFYCFDQVM